MKKIFLAVFLMLMGMSIYAQTSSEWKWIHPKPQGQYIEWFKMIDANNWVAAADYGNFLKTTNAGLTWTTSTGGYPSILYPGASIFVNFRSGYFFNANTGFLGCQAVKGIVKTTNGGQTFDTVNLGISTNSTTYGIYFLNSQTGYIVGTSGIKCMKTSDGGSNWTMMSNLGTSTLYGVYASDTNNVIVGGSTSGKLFKTSNAGVSWDTINLGVTNTIYNIKFTDANTGYLCGSSGLFRYTTNGGLNWAGTNPGTTSSLYNISVSGSDVYLSGTVTTQNLFLTTDFGTSWSTVSYAGQGSITSMNAYGFDKFGNTMAVAGTYGEIIISTNNGANWSSANYRTSLANLTDIYAQSNNGRVIAVGVNNGSPDVIMYSSNGGNTWNTANYIATDYINTINMLNASTGFISGRWGRFAKTTDGGVTWDTSKTANPILAPYFCNSVDFINESTGWIVGGTPGTSGITKIWKTTDAGSNWIEQVSAYSGPIGVKIDMINANTGYMTDNLVLQKTTNGGENWSLTTNPSTSASVSYTPIKVLDANTVFTAGSNTQVYATTNGGTTWDSLNFPVKAGSIFCTDWYDINNGVVGALIGLVGKTTNRGQSWQIYNTGGYTVTGVQMVHPDSIFAISGNTSGAQIFKYTKSTITSGFTYEHNIPADYSLKQNYPNPFNPVTTIEFDLIKAGNVSIKIYDLTGREYSSDIRNINLIPGNYKMNFNASDLSSGVYFYSLNVNGVNIATKKMMLIK